MNDSAPHNGPELRAMESRCEPDPADEASRRAQDLEDGSLDPDELSAEPEWWDEGSDDEG